MSSTTFTTRTEIESRFQHMKRQKHIFVWMACGLVLVAALAAGITWAVRRDRAMHAALRELQEWNQADTVFTSDSVARVLVEYYDRPWHRANDQMLAYYLLGRAYADMGEAPQAIEAYQTAVERADTTDEDCDFRILRNIYGQMAEVFDAQNLPEDEIDVQKKYNHYSWMIGDTLEGLLGPLRLECAYYLLDDTDVVIQNAESARKQLLYYGYQENAALALLMPAYYFAVRGQHDEAKEAISIIREESAIFDDEGNLKPGKEMFYYTIGLYFDGINQLDSAEYYYRRVLAAGEFEAGYKGLLSVYSKRGIADSIAKFAPLYADANDVMHREMNSAEVHKTTSLYNYNRHLRQAQKERQARQHLKNILLFILSAVLIIGAIAYQAYRREKEEQNRLTREYHHAIQELEDTRQEIGVLREAAGQWAGKEALLASKEQKLQELQRQLFCLQTRLKAPYDTVHPSQAAMADIIQNFHTIATHHTMEAASQKTKHIQPRAAKANEWKKLIELVGIHYHRFYIFITIDHQLSNQEYRVCILSRLQFETSEIATLLGTSLPAISNARKSIAAKLFQLESAIDLDTELMKL